MFDYEETKQYFEQAVSDKYFEFLSDRHVMSKGYQNALTTGSIGFLTENYFYVDGVEYSVGYILGAGKESIYDLIRVNQLYGVSAEEGTVFAVAVGDDYLFFKPNDEKVYFFSRDTEQDFCIANSYEEFIKNIQE